MIPREWVTLGAGVMVILAVVVWALGPSAGERVLQEVAQRCGVNQSVIYYSGERTGANGRLIAIDYATDGGRRQNFTCIDRQLAINGVRRETTYEIDI